MASQNYTPAEIDHILYDIPPLTRSIFRGVAGTFFGLALISVIGRMVIRIRTRRNLFLDDYIVLFGLANLIGATGVLYYDTNNLFVNDALDTRPELLAYLVPQLDQLLLSLKYLDVFLGFIWTTTFSVKFSFLAFFHQLISRVTKIRVYFWIVVAITFMSWAFLVSEPFILCKQFGLDAISCRQPSQNLLYVSLSGFITGLDALTDIMLVSIPIIILRRARIKLQQKFALGFFLCLSLFMVVIAIVRVSNIKGVNGIDLRWELFWQYMEGSVAILMASITAFRTIFLNQTPTVSEKKKKRSYSLLERIEKRRRKQKDLDTEASDNSYHLPDIPRATMTGLRTHIRRNNRTGGTTNIMATDFSHMEADEEEKVGESPNNIHIKQSWEVTDSLSKDPIDI